MDISLPSADKSQVQFDSTSLDELCDEIEQEDLANLKCLAEKE